MGNDQTKAAETIGLLAICGVVVAVLGGLLAALSDSGPVQVVGIVALIGGQLALFVGLVGYGVELGLRSSGTRARLDQIDRDVRRLVDDQR